MESDSEEGREAKTGGTGGAAPGAAKNSRSPRPNLALDRAILFATWLIPVLEGFPRSQRFLLGDRVQHNTLELIERLIEANYQKHPQETLRYDVGVAVSTCGPYLGAFDGE